MSDELRTSGPAHYTMISLHDARELCRKYPPGGPGIDCMELYDRFKLARDQCLAAYLSEHPADSETAITEEWLRSVGFFSIDPCFPDTLCIGMIRRYWQDGEHCWYLWGCNHQIKAPQTRGSVRQFCRALGIALKE